MFPLIPTLNDVFLSFLEIGEMKCWAGSIVCFLMSLGAHPLCPIHIGHCGLHSLGVTTPRDAADQESRKYDSDSPAGSSTLLAVLSPALTQATQYVSSLVRL
jgi:hypothetical protein